MDKLRGAGAAVLAGENVLHLIQNIVGVG